MTLHEKLALIQSGFKAPKNQYNGFGKYNYRSAEDILEALKPVEKEHGVFFTIQEELVPHDKCVIIKSTATISDGEKMIKADALVGVDMEQKGMALPQRFGSASSYGKKYALGNLLMIDDSKDPDASNDHGKKAVPEKTPENKQPISDAAVKSAADAWTAGNPAKKKEVEAKLRQYALTEKQSSELFNTLKVKL